MNNFFEELKVENLDIPKKEVNQVSLNLDVNDFIDNDVILIKSGTATGKTKNISKIFKQLKDKDDKLNIMCIINLRTLAKEQIKTFNEQYITLKDYQTNLKDFESNSGVICINSLYKLNDLDIDFKNTVLYIDEINDLINALTHSDSLDKYLNSIYTYLIKLIKNCKKIIISDATINQNALNLLFTRKADKRLLINNVVKKFDKIKCVKHNDENEFIDELKSHIKAKNYFLFGCDGNKAITTIYTSLIEQFKEQKDDFLLITGDTLERPDANEFKNKYVFYSPSITTGVSYVNIASKQDQFIYTTKKPLITPISIYQMSCRTRNMNKLMMYSAPKTSLKKKFETLEECENHYKNVLNINEKILRMSKSTNEQDELSIIENTFFKLFCYNEYQHQVFQTGFEEHTDIILNNAGFTIETKGELKALEKDDKQDMNEVYNQMIEGSFDEFVSAKYKICNDETDFEENDNELKKRFKVYNDRNNLLNLSTKEQTNTYKYLIMDEFRFLKYYNVLNLFKTDDYIKSKLCEKDKTGLKIKTFGSIFNKISLIKKFEVHYNISRFDLDIEKIKCDVEIDDDYKLLYKSLFPKKTTKKYTTKYDIMKNYVNLIHNICGDLEIIEATKTTKDKKNFYKYDLKLEYITDLINLCKFKNPLLKNYNHELIETLTKIKPDEKPKNIIKGFIDCDDIEQVDLYDEDDIVNDFKFGKT